VGRSPPAVNGRRPRENRSRESLKSPRNGASTLGSESGVISLLTGGAENAAKTSYTPGRRFVVVSSNFFVELDLRHTRRRGNVTASAQSSIRSRSTTWPSIVAIRYRDLDLDQLLESP